MPEDSRSAVFQVPSEQTMRERGMAVVLSRQWTVDSASYGGSFASSTPLPTSRRDRVAIGAGAIVRPVRTDVNTSLVISFQFSVFSSSFVAVIAPHPPAPSVSAATIRPRRREGEPEATADPPAGGAGAGLGAAGCAPTRDKIPNARRMVGQVGRRYTRGAVGRSREVID